MDMISASAVNRLKELFTYGMFEARAPDVNHLGNDSDGDFFRKHGADVEADGHINALQAFARNSFTLELFGNRANLPFAADHTDVASIGLYRPAEHVLIFLMAASDDDDVR